MPGQIYLSFRKYIWAGNIDQLVQQQNNQILHIFQNLKLILSKQDTVTDRRIASNRVHIEKSD